MYDATADGDHFSGTKDRKLNIIKNSPIIFSLGKKELFSTCIV